MATKNRWTEAQSYEKKYWEKSARRIEEGQGSDLSWYEWKAGWLKEKLEAAYSDETIDLSDKKIIEVGSGPVGVISYMEGKERYALDPLCDFYSTQPAFAHSRSEGVKYVNTQGENLQFEAETFDMGILDNVIDHVLNADSVIDELHRVIKDGSTLFFTVNLHPTYGYFLHRIISRLKIDKGHPHTFTLAKIRSFLNNHGFEILYEEHEPFKECLIKDLKSSSYKDKVKALTGLSEFLYVCVAKKV